MKKTIAIIVTVLLLCTGVVLGVSCCSDKTCEHAYDNACDAICNECGETRTITHDFNAADCDTPKTCKVCGATEGEKLGHDWTTPDVDLCKVQSTCSRCGATDGENVEHAWTAADCESARSCSVCGVTDGEKLGHTPNEDDGNCLTAITCQRCPEVLTAARTEHEANADDNDCTTAVTCKHCTTVLTEAKANHEASEDDDDCTTDIICKHCTQVAVKGNANHTPNNDDGNCLTEIKCGVCGEVTTAGKTEHIAHADDGDCTTPVTCTACDTVITAAKAHDFTGDWMTDATQHWHVCKNEGCTVTDTKADHVSDGAATTAKPEKCTECNYIINPQLPHDCSYTVANKDATHHWMECTCGAIDESTKVAHTATDDHDCTTPDVCSCGHTVRAAKDHEAGADDGNCTTPVKCVNCNQNAVAGNANHTPNADDGNCLTEVTCKHCTTVMTEAKATHEASEDDDDCTTDIICKHCTQVAVAGNENHSPNADDNNCETPIVCSVCGKTTTEAKEHDFTGEWQKVADGHYHICQNDGCTVEDTKNGHSGGTATCLVGKLCETCGYEYEGENPDNHASDVYTYEANNKETHKKIHECGVVVDEADEHIIIDGECECGIYEITIGTMSAKNYDGTDRVWKSGDTIKVDVWDKDNGGYERTELTYDGTSWGSIITDIKNPVVFATIGKGMYNNEINADTNSYSLCIKAEQDGTDKVDDYDQMYAYNPNVDTKIPLVLEFKHLFTKLTINIEYGSEFTATPKVEYVLFVSGTTEPYVTITGIGTDNLQFEYVEYEGINPTQFIDYGDEADMTDDTVEVIVGIGTLPAGCDFIHFYDRFGTTEPWKKVLVPEGGLTFKDGEEYEFKILITADGAYIVCNDGCNFTYTVGENGTHTKTCADCGYETTETHSFDETTCKCECGEVATFVSNEAELMAALEKGGNIILTADIALSEENGIGLDVVANTTINLNGHALTSRMNVLNVYTDCTLTVIGDGTISNANPEVGFAIDAEYGGKVNIISGNVNSVNAMEGGTVDISNCTIEILYVANGGIATISGGTIETMNVYGDASVAVSGGHIDTLSIIDGDSTLTITGGTFGFNPTAYLAEGCTATEADGKWTVTKTN